jgi:hypothetical protein
MKDLTASLAEKVGADVDHFGGVLRCEVCGIMAPMKPGRAGEYLGSGWPQCHGRTMMWWTRRQIDAGEMPAFVG